MTSGLVVFILVLCVDIAVLAFDAWLKWGLKTKTISRRCWEHPWYAVPLIAWQLLGAAGLTYHLFVPDWGPA